MQVVNLHDDIDLSVEVKRDDFLNLTADLVTLVEAPVRAALESAELTPADIVQVCASRGIRLH